MTLRNILLALAPLVAACATLPEVPYPTVEQRAAAKHIELPTNLVVRESCGVKLRVKAMPK